MNSSEHKYLYITKNYLFLFNSLQRYFQYSLQKELKEFSVLEFNPNTDLLLIHSEEKENPAIIEILTSITNNKALLLSYGSGRGISLLNLSKLKTAFSKIITDSESIDTIAFTRDELVNKHGNLFKTHGEISLLKALSTVKNCILNYNYHKQGGISDEDYSEYYLLPAVNSWKIFTERLRKYENFLLLLGYKDKLSRIQSMIDAIESLIKGLAQTAQNQTDLDLPSEKVQETLAFIDEIDNILFAISSTLGIGDAPIHNTDRR